MNKKGFTLIELLAVIVILAVIALIVTPAITGIVSTTRTNAFLQSCNGVIQQANYFVSGKLLRNDSKKKYFFDYTNSKFVDNTNNEEIEISGEKFTSGHLYIDNGLVSLYICHDKECAVKSYHDTEPKILSEEDKDKYLYNYAIGDKVILPDGSYWRVIENNGDKIKLFSEYDMKYDSKWIQSKGDKYFVAYDVRGDRTTSNGNTYCTSALGCGQYAANGTTVISDSSIKKEADKYLASLIDNKIVKSDTKISLITKDQLVSLGCTVGAGDTPGRCDNAPEYVKGIYWTMTDRNSSNTQDVWFVSNNELSYDCASREGYSFRPVIEIDKNWLNGVINRTRDNNDQKKVNSVWMWGNNEQYDLILHPELAGSTLKTLSQKGINTIYLSVDIDNIAIYKNVIELANKNGIDIYCLIGDPHFIVEKNYQKCIYDSMNAISAFNQAYSPTALIKGIHYDVEFYGFADDDLDGLGAWIDGDGETAKQELRRKNYIKFVRTAYQYATKLGIFVENDVTPYTNMFSFYDTDNVNKNMLTEVLKVSDDVSLMTYGNGTKNTIYPILYTGEFLFGDGTKNTVDKSILDKLNEQNIPFQIGQDLEIIYNTAKELEDHPENGPTYLPEYQNSTTGKTDYAFTPEFVERVEKETAKQINEECNNKNYNILYGFAFHDYRYLMKLLNNAS